MSGLVGSGVGEGNTRLRLLCIFLAGVVVFASVLYWRAQVMFAAEYQEFPTHQPKKKFNQFTPQVPITPSGEKEGYE